MTRAEIEAGLDQLNQEFMTPEIAEKQRWYYLDGDHGVVYVPVEDAPRNLKDCYPGRITEVNRVEGFGARLSASGYLDATDWTVHPTVTHAEAYLVETYAD